MRVSLDEIDDAIVPVSSILRVCGHGYSNTPEQYNVSGALWGNTGCYREFFQLFCTYRYFLNLTP